MNNVIAPPKRSIGELIHHLAQEMQTGWHRRDHAQNLKLFYPQSAVRQSLVEVGLLDWVEVYTDLSQAIQALAQPTSR